MERLVSAIVERLQYECPWLSYIDEDYGQLEALDNENDTYPLTFPSALVSFESCTWDNRANLNQQGEATLTVKLCIDCYDDTHKNSGTIEKVREREMLLRAMTKALHGWRPSDDTTALTRQGNQYFTGNHGIKVYQVTFTCKEWEDWKGSEEKVDYKPEIKVDKWQ